MQAIRIEHEDGQGMFIVEQCDELGMEIGTRYDKIVGPEFLPTIRQRHTGVFKGPGRETFADQFISGKHFFAYKSIEQLRQWVFPEEMIQLLDRGYKVYLLNLSEAIEGEMQIIYMKKDIISKQDISSLFK